jgi:translocation and assembly module TamB
LTKRGAKIAAWVAGVLIGLPLLGLVLISTFANTGAGRAAIETLAAKFSGGDIVLQGLSGRFPDALRLAHGEIRDKDGTWLTLDDVALDWSPSRLLAGVAAIDTLSAAHIDVARLPVSESGTKSKTGAPPLRLVLGALRVDRLELGAALAGLPAVARVAGKLDVASLTQGDVALDVERLDGPGSYHLAGTMTAAGDDVRLDIAEPARGLLGALAGLPDLGALSVAATLAGPRHAERLGLAMRAGALRGNGQGTVDLTGQNLDLDLAVAAPAMTPRPDLHWQSASLDLHVHGAFTAPSATGKLAIADLVAGGASIARVSAEIQGDRGKLDGTGALDQLRLPGAQPDLFAAAPVTFRAEAILDDAKRPVSFTIAHPLLDIRGQAQLSGDIGATVTATVPDLAPFAALGAADVRGKGAITARFAQQGETKHLTLDGTVDVVGGQAIAAQLLGDGATLSLAASAQGDDVTLDRASIDGRAIHVSAHGALSGGTLDVDWGATLADVADVAPTLSGPLSLEGRLQGPQDDLALTMQGHGRIAARGLSAGAIDATITARGLPAHPTGQIELRGQLAEAPVMLAAKFARGDDGATQLRVDRAQWKSLDALGDMTLAAGSVFPVGRMQLHATRLADLAPLIGMPIGGSVEATLDTMQSAGAPQVRLHAEARQLTGLGDRAEHATLDATIKDPATRPVAAMQIALTGITAANGITGSARLEANGPQEALAVRLTTDLATADGPAHIVSAGTARLPQRELQLTALQADYRGATVRLLGPARLRLAQGIAVDQLRLGTGDAALTIAGQIAPVLRLTVSLRNATPALAKPFFPTLDGSGNLALDATFGGTLAAPTGTVRATGRGLRVRNGAGAAMPAADLDATATLHGDGARIDARVNAGTNLHLQLTGTVPLNAAAPFDLHSGGSIDLVMLDPLLNAGGRSVRGQVTLDLGFAGTMASPRLTGSARLADGAIQDFLEGIHITAIGGTIAADGDTLRLTQLSGKAGDGTITVSGTIAIAAPMPVNLTIATRNARPLASDLVNATLDSDLTLKGDAEGALALAGRIHVSRADIQIPDSLPQSVAVLDVRKPGEKAPPPPVAAPIALSLVVDAPQQVFVRGHGLDAEMGGELRLSGSSRTPEIGGGFDLRRGTFSLAGQTLDFTSGRVAFDGFGLNSKLDPTLDFVAESAANNVTATLTITGYADSPKIRLSSTPDLPQDEILAQLLFGQSVKQLTPFQVIEIAQAVAAISGVGGAGDPLAGVRKGLGLDRLSVGAASGNSPGATVEAGRYVANGVYVGTKQGSSGGTQARVQIDLTKHLKLETQLGTGGAPATGAAVTPDNDPGSGIGLTYQLEY